METIGTSYDRFVIGPSMGFDEAAGRAVQVQPSGCNHVWTKVLRDALYFKTVCKSKGQTHRNTYT